MSHTRIRILCVDDHPVVREGIVLLIGTQPDMQVVACASSGQHAVESFHKQRPDVTLMDLRLPVMSGLDAIKAIRREHGDAKIIVLTMYQGDEDIYRAVQAGASAYLTKDTLSDQLIRTIRTVHAGQPVLSPEVVSRLAAGTTLTNREVQVVELLSKGMRNKEIAAELGISEQTARVHMKNILAKLHVNDRAAALTVAAKRGIIHID